MKSVSLVKPVLSLEQVSQNFTHWRTTRIKRGKIPKELMAQAFTLLGQYKPTKISSTLGLCYSHFRKQCIGNGLIKVKHKPTTFVEVKTSPINEGSLPINFSISRADGAILQISVSDSHTAGVLLNQFLS